MIDFFCFLGKINIDTIYYNCKIYVVKYHIKYFVQIIYKMITNVDKELIAEGVLYIDAKGNLYFNHFSIRKLYGCICITICGVFEIQPKLHQNL